MDKPTMDWVITHYNLAPTRQGFICCPAHEESTPSCQLHEDWWYCFGCGANGDSLGLIAAITNTPIADVLREHSDNTESWKRQARRTKQIEAVRAAPARAYRELKAWFWAELASRLEDADDWLVERTVTYWTTVFEDDWDHWFVPKSDGYDAGVPVVRREERLRALGVLLERGLALERSDAWDRKEGEWHLAEGFRVGVERDRRPS